MSLIKTTVHEPRTWNQELESLRGVAALLVFMHHFFEGIPVIDSKIFINSYLMVDLFFVLSGFVIFNAYADKINSSLDLLRFQFLRFGRLYPVHLLFVVLFLLFALAKYLLILNSGYTGARNHELSEYTLFSVLCNLLLIETIFPSLNVASINVPAWSISVEFYTYLIFGFVVLLLRKIKNFIFSLLVIISIFALAFNLAGDYSAIFRCFAGFFSGCITAGLIKKVNFKCSRYASFIFILLLLLFLHIKPEIIHNTVIYYDVLIYFLASLLIAAIVLNPYGALNIILKNKILACFGLISYSLYMSHMLIIHLVAGFFKFFLRHPDIQMADGTWQPSLTNFEVLIAFVSSFCITLIVSYLIFNYIEKPFRNESRRFAFEKLSG